jgi:hypothetical protein
MKNRNKKLRTIVTDGQEYKWLIGSDNILKIWKDKNLIYENDHSGCDVTPQLVSDVILDLTNDNM